MPKRRPEDAPRGGRQRRRRGGRTRTSGREPPLFQASMWETREENSFESRSQRFLEGFNDFPGLFILFGVLLIVRVCGVARLGSNFGSNFGLLGFSKFGGAYFWSDTPMLELQSICLIVTAQSTRTVSQLYRGVLLMQSTMLVHMV